MMCQVERREGADGMFKRVREKASNSRSMKNTWIWKGKLRVWGPFVRQLSLVKEKKNML